MEDNSLRYKLTVALVMVMGVGVVALLATFLLVAFAADRLGN